MLKLLGVLGTNQKQLGVAEATPSLLVWTGRTSNEAEA